MSLLTLFDGDSFSPRRLFLASTIGAIYDYDDFAYLYQKSDGSTPVTALEQPVGLMLDKRWGGARGSEVINSTWTTSATVSNAAGTLTFTAASSALADNATNGASVTAGKWYYAELTVSSFVGGGASFSIGSVGQGSIATANGRLVSIFNASATGQIQVRARLSATTLVISNISIRELPGLHAYQATDAARPVLSARYNLLLNTVFAGAVAGTPGTAPTSWALTGAGGTLGVDSSATDAVLTFSATAAREYLAQNVTLAANTSYTYGATLTANSGLAIQEILTATLLPSGSVTYTINGASVAGTVAPVAGDTIRAIVAIGVTGGATSIRIGAGCSGNVTGSVSMSKPDLRLTADANSRIPAYQRVTTATDYDSAGFPRFLRVDATDDFLQTASVDPATDKVFVCAGVTKMSDAAAAIVVESSINSGTTAGTFALLAPTGGGLTTYQMRSGGSVPGVLNTVSGYAAPHTAVLSGIGDIGGDSVRTRANGAEGSPVTTDQGTGNYSAQQLFIGARNGATARVNNGRIYPMVICFKAVTAGEIAATEAYINARTRAY